MKGNKVAVFLGLAFCPVGIIESSSLDPQGVYRFCDFDHAPCDDLHRICLLEESSNATVCGPCQKGHIEFETECVEIENLDYDAFVSSYKVVLSDAMKANQSLSERLESLREGSMFIAQHNLPEAQQEGLWKPPDFFLGLTPYSSDSTAEDYRSRSGYFYQNETQLEVFRHRNLQEEGSLLLPRTLDWVERGGVTHVKDQGRLEGIATLNEYPYTDYFGKTTTDCRTDVPVAAQVNIARRVGGFDANISPQERILSFKKALQVQPVAVVMKSSCRILSNYRRGVITDDGECACQSPDCLDHAVLLVGYEDDAPIPYFRLKNSWGTLWGEDGYFNVAQSTIDSGSYGLFGILSEGVLLTGQNTTTMVEDEIQKSPLSKWWSILLLTLASLCSFVIIYGVARKHCF